MSLVNLIEDLNDSNRNNRLTKRQINYQLKNRVVFPEGFDVCKAKLQNESLDNIKETLPLHLSILAVNIEPREENSYLLNEAFDMVKNLNIKKGIATAMYKLTWEPEDFLNEKKPEKLKTNKFKIEANAYTCETKEPRILGNKERHLIEATLKGNELSIQASGNYRKHLKDIFSNFEPNFATIILSKDDSYRTIRNISHEIGGEKAAKRLEKILTPAKIEIEEHQLDKISKKEEEINLLQIPYENIESYEDILGKPLICPHPSQMSQVTQFTKIYSPMDTLLGKNYSDFRSIARDISNINFDVPYTAPVLSDSGARDLISREMDILYTILKTGQSSFILEEEIEKLVEEHFSEEKTQKIFSQIYGDFSSYMKLLSNFGYKPEKNFENEVHPDIAKYIHLLEFFRQSYEKNPDESIQQYRQFYKNTPPSTKIEATGETDISSLNKIKMPDTAKLKYFEINPQAGKRTYNDLSIEKTQNEEVGVHSTINTEYPIILPIQEYILQGMGFKFK